mmetsp:Transcript_1571/g.4285  ORF Transcript_1571/g.4285 Transcript_1571/m.4285 type:complete len:177 (-) Transcript_1571:1379-1909(-)
MDDIWKLGVVLKSVKHLPRTDDEVDRDVYAQLSIGDSQVFRTKSRPDTFDAAWKDEFEFHVPCHDAGVEEESDTISEDNVLTIEFFNSESNREPEYIGSVIVNLRDLWNGENTDETLEKYFHLRNMRANEICEVQGHDQKTSTLCLSFKHLGNSCFPCPKILSFLLEQVPTKDLRL